MSDVHLPPLESADWLWVAYHDYAGVARGKAVPSHQFDAVLRSGITFAKANWDIALNDHQVPDPLFAADSGDFRVVPDVGTLISLPRRPRVAHALAWLYDGVDRWDGDPRGRLAEQVAHLSALGFRVLASFESEFILLERLADGRLVPARSGPMFNTSDLDGHWPIFAEVLASIEAAGIRVHQFAKEYGPAQFEISFLPLPPVEAADAFLVARQLLKAAVRDAGFVASFMPKPQVGLPGNGLHIHLSLWNKAGTEVIGDSDDPTRLSEIGSWGIGGLLRHARALTALGAASPNSYRRLFPGSWAPAHVAWGFGNRAALVRVPGLGSARRFEYRSGDASASPYLFLTGLLAAIADGIQSKHTPPAPMSTDIGRWSDEMAAEQGIARLPASLLEAVAALETDEVIQDALGPVVSQHYPVVKRFEQASFEGAGGSEVDPVTDYEIATYLEVL